jgi:hypothetical protein
LNLVAIVALTLAWLPVTSVAAALVLGTHASPTQQIPVDTLLNPDGTLDTSTGASGALDLRGWNVTLDSERGPILTRDAPAAPNADTWSALANNGLNGPVQALAVIGSDLYVGGEFTQTADGTVTNLNRIAKYSGGAWSALAHNGLNNTVNALAVSGSDLYVGGSFSQTSDGVVTNLSRIAKYSGGAWSALANNGLNNEVLALAVIGSDLYVGGGFIRTADAMVTNLNYIAKYSGGAWSALANNGLNNPVFALAVSASDLYVGGYFTQTADGTMNLYHIAKWEISAVPGYRCYLPVVSK